jgi:hypothetical protein
MAAEYALKDFLAEEDRFKQKQIVRIFEADGFVLSSYLLFL